MACRQAQNALASKFDLAPELIDVQALLMSVKGFGDHRVLMSQDWTTESTLIELEGVDLSSAQAHERIQIDNSLLPAASLRLLTEQKVKHACGTWFVYKYDSDRFPVLPHAHNYEANIKLDFGTEICSIIRNASLEVYGVRI